MKKGYSQLEIHQALEEADIKPNSVSTIEKILKEVRREYAATSLFQLACILMEDEEFHFDDGLEAKLLSRIKYHDHSIDRPLLINSK